MNAVLTSARQLTFGELRRRMDSAGWRATLLGIGPVSETVVRATFQVAREEGMPPMFIASRNQVDLEEFGSGYLLGGMDQAAFVRLLKRVGEEEGYDGPLFVCRDHGGPWQRNRELDEKFPVEEAMAIARRSFRGDLLAGFNYLHVDPTKCPHDHTPDDLVRWTVDLIADAEKTRLEANLPPVDYEIGTEDIRGGDTSDEHFERFLERVAARLQEKRLPLPVCVVGQTGTLTKLNRNDGGFHADTARRLTAIARRHNLGFKEHNTDYLDNHSLSLHPDIGITGANVAPEFGYVETAALLELAAFEAQAFRGGWRADGGESGLAEKIAAAVRDDAPWRKWLPAAFKTTPESAVFGDAKLARLVTEVCGHYTFDRPDIREARRRLEENVGKLWGTRRAADHALSRVRESIRRYVRLFNLSGVNALASL